MHGQILLKDMNEIIKHAMKQYNGDHIHVKDLKNVNMNFVFEFMKNDNSYILRISRQKGISARMVAAELDWINYLAANSIPVSKPISTINRESLITLKLKETQCIITAFEKAKGRHVKYEEWNSKLFKNLGKIVGKIHGLSKEYSMETEKYKRFDWQNSIYIEIVNNAIPKEQTNVFSEYNSLKIMLNALPKNKDSYGMIHGDINVGNFFIDEDNITLFDFDGCEYNWFVNDIAVAVFYAVLFFDPGDGNEIVRAKEFLKYFLEGYCLTNNISNYWIKKINLFLKLREFILYGLIYDNYNLNNLPYFLKVFMNNRKEKIENNDAFLELDTL